MSSKMLLKIMCFLGRRFGRVLGGVLRGFWEAENLDFRIVFDVFSKQKSKCVLEVKKIRKKTRNQRPEEDFWVGPAECAASWGEKKRGVRSLKM